ncbi:3-deoxy-manno-octulosonate cytidylyltransferase, partial [bacterium]|nr:3-deoxy-manno-octulosonate cytidylyltransferase [bacterium]
VYTETKKCSSLQEIYIATDDERIFSFVESFGGKAIMTPTDCESGTDRAAKAIEGIEADIIVNVQGDQPFIDPVMIDEGVQPLLEDDDIKISTLMHPIHNKVDYHNPGIVKIIVDLEGNALYCSRSIIPYPQKNIPHHVYEHIGLYIYTREFLKTLAGLSPTPLEQIESLEQLRVLEHGYKLRVIETKCQDNAFHGFNVDTEEDVLRAEKMLREKNLS